MEFAIGFSRGLTIIMCGIYGIVGKGWERSQIENMVRVQHHRGPDDYGIITDDIAALGHNRLSIIDLSKNGHQPMCNHNKTIWIVFNGEIYNYQSLRKELCNYCYHSNTDTEVILSAYEEWGERCVEHFIGMFAFAIWDVRRKTLFCARDRLGIKPFHYTQHNNCFVFSSEIKGILASGFPAEPDLSTWAEYLTYGYFDHSNSTFFKGITTLAPGHTLTLCNGKMNINRYWHLPDKACNEITLTDNEASEQFLSLFTDSVNLRLRSDVPVGINLSSGLDSASLAVISDRCIKNQGVIETFTVSFEDKKYDEEDFASKVLHKKQWVRNIQRLSEHQVWDLAQESMWYLEAPFGGISTLAYYNLHRLAKERGITVLLEGQGVDEMLAGYSYLFPAYYRMLLDRGECSLLRNELRTGMKANSFQSIDALRKTMDGTTILYQDGSSFLKPECILTDIRKAAGDIPYFESEFKSHLTNLLYRDLRYTKLPRVLRMNDRLSMAFSRELREPYIDHRIVEFIFSLSSSQKIRNGQTKFILRNAMKKLLPDEIRCRSKQAVVTPQREWTRTCLKTFY